MSICFIYRRILIMRMWNIPPQYLCRKHLLGEHVEMHMFLGTLKHSTSISGYISNNLVDTSLILSRHDELAAELTRRGYTHSSPFTSSDIQFLSTIPSQGSVNPSANILVLSSRCPECRTNLQHLIPAGEPQ